MTENGPVPWSCSWPYPLYPAPALDLIPELLLLLLLLSVPDPDWGCASMDQLQSQLQSQHQAQSQAHSQAQAQAQAQAQTPK